MKLPKPSSWNYLMCRRNCVRFGDCASQRCQARCSEGETKPDSAAVSYQSSTLVNDSEVPMLNTIRCA